MAERFLDLTTYAMDREPQPTVMETLPFKKGAKFVQARAIESPGRSLVHWGTWDSARREFYNELFGVNFDHTVLQQPHGDLLSFMMELNELNHQTIQRATAGGWSGTGVGIGIPGNLQDARRACDAIRAELARLPLSAVVDKKAPYYPASYYKNNYRIKPDDLRRLRRQSKIAVDPKRDPKQHPHYSLPDVRACFPQKFVSSKA